MFCAGSLLVHRMFPARVSRQQGCHDLRVPPDSGVGQWMSVRRSSHCARGHVCDDAAPQDVGVPHSVAGTPLVSSDDMSVTT